MLQDLQDKGILALSQTSAVTTSYQTTGNALRKESIESIIEAMYELSELTEKESALLSVFAVLPAESIAFKTLEMLIPDTGALEETLTALAQKGWLDYNDTSASFKVSPVIQEITKKTNLQLLQDCKGVFNSLSEKLLYEPGTGGTSL